MPERDIPFHLYDTPDPPADLSDKIEARLRQEQRLVIANQAERRQSWKLPLAIGATAALAVAVAVLAVIGLRGSHDPAATPAPVTVLGGAPPTPVANDHRAAVYRPLAARKLVAPGRLRQFPDPAARAKLLRAIARARSARLAAQGTAAPQARVDHSDIRAMIDQADLGGCYTTKDSLVPDYGLVVAMVIVGEPGHGRVVDEVTISADGNAIADPALVECVTQTLLSLHFPPPLAGGRSLTAYPLPSPVQPIELDDKTAKPAKPAKPVLPDLANATVDRARAAAKGGRFTESLLLAEAVLERKPNDQDALMVAVIAACNTNNPKPAVAYLGRLKSDGRRGMGEQICEKTLGYPLKAKPPAACIDEVACLIADKPPACCLQYGRDKQLDRAAIKAGMAAVRTKIAACGTKHASTGAVKIKVKVAPAGHVSSASVEQAPNKPLGSCIADQVRQARFKATRGGATFVYPFVFR